MTVRGGLTQTEDLPQRKTESLNGSDDLVRRCGREGGAEKQLVARIAGLGSEPAALRYQDPPLDRGEEDVVLDLEHRSAPVFRRRVFAPIDLDPVEHARHGRVPTRHLPGQVLLAGVADVVSSFRVLQSDVDEPIQVARVSPRVLQQLEHDQLGKPAGVLDGHFGVAGEAFRYLLRSCDPA